MQIKLLHLNQKTGLEFFFVTLLVKWQQVACFKGKILEKWTEYGKVLRVALRIRIRNTEITLFFLSWEKLLNFLSNFASVDKIFNNFK